MSNYVEQNKSGSFKIVTAGDEIQERLLLWFERWQHGEKDNGVDAIILYERMDYLEKLLKLVRNKWPWMRCIGLISLYSPKIQEVTQAAALVCRTELPGWKIRAQIQPEIGNIHIYIFNPNYQDLYTLENDFSPFEGEN